MVDTTSVDLLSLIGEDVRLRKAAATRGGEWAGPCPFCGGAAKQESDRFRVWPAEGRYWCRRCDRKGDAIDYVRERHNLNFEAALDRLRLPSPQPRRPAARSDRVSQGATTGLAGQPSALLPGSPALASPLHEPLEPPSDTWQGRAIDFCTECIDLLWTKEGARARAWLTGKRGLTEETIAHASLGLIPENRHDPPEIWGFEADEKPVWLPHGILFPWIARGHVWRVSIRRADGDPKYVSVKGSANALYRADTLASGSPAALVEGELDALTVYQHAGGIISAVATGSTTGARRPRWLAQLASCGVVLVAFDSDEAGEEAAAYWLGILPKARRWRPYHDKDVNGMATSGGDVTAWILDGLGSAPW